MKRLVIFVVVLSGFSVSAAHAALVTDPTDPRTWQGAGVGTFAALFYGADTPANRQLVVDNQLLDDGLFNPTSFVAGTLMSTPWANGTGGGASPYPGVIGVAHIGGGNKGQSLDMTGTGSYGYVLSGLDVFDSANGIDEFWFQSSNTVGDTVFDLGFSATKAAIFNSIDHGPIPQEAIESTLFLSNNLTTWTQATVERVWLEGFMTNTGILWDGFVYAVAPAGGGTFRYASVIHGGPGALLNDGDDEINGVMGLDPNFNPVLPAVPTVSDWGMAVLVLLLLNGLTLVARGRRATAT